VDGHREGITMSESSLVPITGQIQHIPKTNFTLAIAFSVSTLTGKESA
jgi:hypothetical protein